MIPPPQYIDITIERLSREIEQVRPGTTSEERIRRGLEVAILKRRLANLRQVRRAQIQTHQEVLREYRDVLSNTFAESISPMITSGVSELFTRVRDFINFDGEDADVFFDSRSSATDESHGDDCNTNNNHRRNHDTTRSADSNHNNNNNKVAMGNSWCRDGDNDNGCDYDHEMEIMWQRIKAEPKGVQIMWKRITSDMAARATRRNKIIRRRNAAGPVPTKSVPTSRRIAERCAAKARRRMAANGSSDRICTISTVGSNKHFQQRATIGASMEKSAKRRAHHAISDAAHHHSGLGSLFDELQDHVSSMAQKHAKGDAVIEELVKRLLVREVSQKNRARKEKKARVHAVLTELMKRFMVKEIHDRSNAQEETRKKIAAVLGEFTRCLVLQEISKTASTRCDAHKQHKKVSRELMERFHSHQDLRDRSDDLLREMVMKWVVMELKEVYHARAVYLEKYHRVIQELMKLFVVKDLNRHFQDKDNCKAKTRAVLKELKERMDMIETVEFRQLVIQDLMNENAARKEHTENVEVMLSELLYKFVVNEMNDRCSVKERADSVLAELKEALEWINVKDENNEWVQLPAETTAHRSNVKEENGEWVVVC